MWDQPDLWSAPAPYTRSQPMVRTESQDTSNGAAVIAMHRKADVRHGIGAP